MLLCEELGCSDKWAELWPREPWYKQREGGAVVNSVAAEAVLDVIVVDVTRRINMWLRRGADCKSIHF